MVHMKQLKNNSLVGNTRHFVNEGLEGLKVDNITPQKIFSSSLLFAGIVPASGLQNDLYLNLKELDEEVEKLQHRQDWLFMSSLGSQTERLELSYTSFLCPF